MGEFVYFVSFSMYTWVILHGFWVVWAKKQRDRLCVDPADWLNFCQNVIVFVWPGIRDRG